MKTNGVGKSVSSLTAQDGAALHRFHPQVVVVGKLRYVTWPADFAGDLMALGLSALGFDLFQQGERYLIPLNERSDELLLRLYDLALSLRWQQRCNTCTVVAEAAAVETQTSADGEARYG